MSVGVCGAVLGSMSRLVTVPNGTKAAAMAPEELGRAILAGLSSVSETAQLSDEACRAIVEGMFEVDES